MQNPAQAIVRRAFFPALAVLLLGALVGILPAHGQPPPGSPNTSVLLSYEDLYSVATPAPRHAVVVGSWGRLLRTVDGGDSWEIRTEQAPRALLDVAFADPQHGWIVGEKGLILHTRDGGRSWELQASKTVWHLLSVAVIDARRAVIVGERGTVLRTADAGTTWVDASLGEDVILNDVQFLDAGRGWIVGEFGTILRTDDGGGTWKPHASIEGAPSDVYLYSAFFTPRYGAAVGLAGTLIWSEDGGATWRAVDSRTRVHLYAITGIDGQLVAVGDRAVIRRIRAAAAEPPERMPETAGWLRDVEFAGSEGFAVGSKANVLRSRDGGRSWVDVSPREGPLSEPGPQVREAGH